MMAWGLHCHLQEKTGAAFSPSECLAPRLLCFLETSLSAFLPRRHPGLSNLAGPHRLAIETTVSEVRAFPPPA